MSQRLSTSRSPLEGSWWGPILGVLFFLSSLLSPTQTTAQSPQEHGLQAVYYAAGFDDSGVPCNGLEGPTTFTQIDPVLDIVWSGAPISEFCSTGYLARWSGYITALDPGRYYIYLDARARNTSLRVGDQLFAGRTWGRSSGGWVDLDPEHPQQVIVEVKTIYSTGGISLKWRTEDEEGVVIPAEALTPELPAEEGHSAVMLAVRDSISVEGHYDGGGDAARNTSDTFTFTVHRTPPFTDPLVVNLSYGGEAQRGVDFKVLRVLALGLTSSPMDRPEEIIIPAGASMVHVQGVIRDEDLTYQGDLTSVVEVISSADYDVYDNGQITLHLIDNDFPPTRLEDPPSDPLPDVSDEGDDQGGDEDPSECISDLDHFIESVWRPIIEPQCTGCHRGGGIANHSSMIYDIAGDTPNTRRANLATFRRLAPYRWRDLPILMAKPLGLAAHGGGQILYQGDPALDALQAMITRSLLDPEDCSGANHSVDALFESVEFLGPRSTFRRAALRLARRLPTERELQHIEDDGWDGFDIALNLLLLGEDFNQRFASLWEEVFRLKANVFSSLRYHLDKDTYPYDRWGTESVEGTPETPDVAHQIFERESLSLNDEPFAIIRHILRERLPFGELLTADYTLLNSYLARTYGVYRDIKDEYQNSLNPLESVLVRIPDFPHAGILTTPAFLIQMAGHRGDRNRTRSEAILRLFGDRANLNTSAASMDMGSLAHNPTQNDAQCAGCHQSIDSTAGLFRNWNSGGGYIPENGWYLEMPLPALGEVSIPQDLQRQSLKWMAQEIVSSDAFARAMVAHVYRILLERMPLDEPIGDEPYTSSYAAVYSAQQDFFERLATVFQENNQEIRILIKAIVKSRWYRAKGYSAAEDTPVGSRRYELDQMGHFGLLDPIALNSKLTQTTGYRWQESGSKVWYLSDRSTPFFYLGGWSSSMDSGRSSTPNALAVNTHRALALQTACRMIPYEFWLMTHRGSQQKRVLPFIFDDASIFDETGALDPEVAGAVRDNIQYLMSWLWDQDVDDEDDDLDELFTHFVETVRAGQERLSVGDVSPYLYYYCRGSYDYENVTSIPNADILNSDSNHMIRAWMSMLYVFLTDPLFVLEGGE